MKEEETKRLFWGFSVEAPWPATYPKGRIIDEPFRHITLAFLGQLSFTALKKELSHFSPTDSGLGPVGYSDQLLFLPEVNPRVVAHHIKWLVDRIQINKVQKKVQDWLEEQSIKVDQRPFLPHVTIARAPFFEKEWEAAFEPLPFVITGLHLYESIGQLRYVSLWQLPFLAPFEEIEHTADIAFRIRGFSFTELYRHAAAAMSFKCPSFLSFISEKNCESLEGVVRALNEMIVRCDCAEGCPFKAVSYHGQIEQSSDKMMIWEMIVDV